MLGKNIDEKSLKKILTDDMKSVRKEFEHCVEIMDDKPEELAVVRDVPVDVQQLTREKVAKARKAAQEKQADKSEKE